VTHTVTTWIADRGVYAVFALMVVAALLPAASEVTMIYAGAVASGAFTAAHVHVFGAAVATPAAAYVTMALAGVVGNVVGAALGWAIGSFGGRPLLESHGRWVHVTPAKLERTDRWLARFGTWAVAAGFLTPLVRSFVAIPAGAMRMRPGRFTVAALLGCVPFCFGLAGAGYALGANWEHFRHDWRYVDYAILALAALAVIALAARTARRRAVQRST
jgi:membrane protein DedA with SNARE-associated domain